jgi:prepilin-type N-terminal cleavage/methylation domain-containing protein
MKYLQKNILQSRGFGFTMIEVIVVLILVGLLAIFSTQFLSNMVRGYVIARSSDEVTQKAQIALQRMTIELSYSLNSTTTGTATSLNYSVNNTVSSIGDHNIYLSGTNLMYTENGTGYVLADGMVANGLRFNYYNAYDSGSNNTFGNSSTNIIGISLTMQGDSWVGVTETFSTRVMVNKIH